MNCRLYFTCLLVCFCQYISAQAFKFDDKGSSISFSIKNLGIKVSGNIPGLSGNVYFLMNKPQLATFNASVDATKLSTSNNLRDEHLRKPEYFDVAQFPTISFTSKKITVNEKKEWMVTGTLTLKGKSKEISFPFTVSIQPDGGLLFEGSFSISRKEFSVGKSSLILSDNATVHISAVAKKV